jgi:hypothetical protein
MAYMGGEVSEQRYEAGVRRAIMRNAAKSRPAKFEAWMANPVNAAFHADLLRHMEIAHRPDKFLRDLWDRLQDYGKLSDPQVAAGIRAFERREQWAQEAEAKRAAENAQYAGSVFVGELKKREVFNLEVLALVPFESAFGGGVVHRMKDAAGNVFIYMGKHLALPVPGEGPREIAIGDRVRVKASMAKHEEYQGVKQNRVSRPVVEAIEPAPEASH